MLAAQTHNGCNIGKVLNLADSNGLHEELVTAFCIQWWILLHRLKQDYTQLSVSTTEQRVPTIVPWTSTSCPTAMTPEFGRTQYLSVVSVKRRAEPCWECNTLLWSCRFDLDENQTQFEETRWECSLTLNAIGSVLVLRRRSICETSCVKGSRVVRVSLDVRGHQCIGDIYSESPAQMDWVRQTWWRWFECR